MLIAFSGITIRIVFVNEETVNLIVACDPGPIAGLLQPTAVLHFARKVHYYII